MRYLNEEIHPQSEMKADVKPIVEGLRYLKDEASREGFKDISDMVSQIICDINKRNMEYDEHYEFRNEPNLNQELNIPKVIELLDTFSKLNKHQIESLNKFLKLIHN